MQHDSIDSASSSSSSSAFLLHHLPLHSPVPKRRLATTPRADGGSAAAPQFPHPSTFLAPPQPQPPSASSSLGFSLDIAGSSARMKDPRAFLPFRALHALSALWRRHPALQAAVVLALAAGVLLYATLVLVPALHALTHPGSLATASLLSISASPSVSRRTRALPRLAAAAAVSAHERVARPGLERPPAYGEAATTPTDSRQTELEAAAQPPLVAASLDITTAAPSPLQWFAPFRLHPGLLSSVPAPYGYTAAALSSLFECWYAQAPIERSAQDGAKVALLLMTRNSADWLLFFLEHHMDVVDAFVVLDDASDDGTLALLHRYGAELKVEAVLAKRRWSVMDEWPDRNLLVQAARQLQATHWIMLDIDELLSYNCVHHAESSADGDPPPLTAFRALNVSHELMELEAVELWGNAHQQRVGLMSKWRFATYDQFSALHPVPAVSTVRAAVPDALDAPVLSPWPPEALHPASVYAQPPYITQGQPLPNGGSAHVGRIPEPIYDHATRESRRRRRTRAAEAGDSDQLPRAADDAVDAESDSDDPFSACRVIHHRFVNDFQFFFKDQPHTRTGQQRGL